ncbi:hypothetical protein [Rhizobium leguminosarum]|uniref:hypothetical protein n=1 Tax=Rhizobium leguminosarum TaxID=384 RepID=UPI001030130E|nr:hypothetical protein [Rhizobium leguminosarum]TBH09909.1 hypothetical protein ELG68_01365 [Rhizobium leguminosarum]
MDRRTFIKAAVVAASTPAAAMAPPAMAASLSDLIERHRQAVVVDRAAWDLASDLDDDRAEMNGSGYATAIGAARSASSVTRNLEAQIVAFIPTTLQEAADKARWIIWAYDDDFCYLHEEGHRLLIEALRAIATAVAPA